MFEIKSNAGDISKDVAGYVDKIQDAIQKGCIKIQEAIMIRSTQGYLQGPRPIHLQIASGRLIRSMQGSFMYEGGGTYGGTNYSILNLSKRGNQIVLTYGTKAFDPITGEPYPEIWEYGLRGDRRAFLSPAIADTKGRFAGLMRTEIHKALNK